jgi:hypothetical protein
MRLTLLSFDVILGGLLRELGLPEMLSLIKLSSRM